MIGKSFKSRKFHLLAGIFAIVSLIIPAEVLSGPEAVASTCGSNYCSGSDGTTGANVQGNKDQFYNGEVGYYYQDLTGGDPSDKPCPSDPGGYCFNTSAASGAIQRYMDDSGIGVQYYYFGGGADSSIADNYSSPFCFGWDQATDAVNRAGEYFNGSYGSSAVFIYLDIEQNNAFGWSNTTQSENRSVFDGFYDNLAGLSNSGDCAGATARYQPSAYSSPDQWSYSFGSYGTIGSTPIITSESCCSSSFPSAFSGAEWFGSSEYKEGYQFDEGPDYDTYYEPAEAPAINTTLGN